MRGYVAELKKFFQIPFFVPILMFFLVLNLLILQSVGYDEEQRRAADTLAALREEKGVKTFGDMKNYMEQVIDYLPEDLLTNEKMAERDVGIGWATQDIFMQFLFRLSRMLFAESAMVSLITGVFLFGVENVSDMEQMIYTTKRGRRIFWQKLGAAVSMTVMVNGLLSVLSLWIFAEKVGYAAFWDIHMNCPYLHEGTIAAKIYAVLQEAPLWQYALAMVGLLLALMALFAIFVICILYMAEHLLKGVGACAVIVLLDYVISQSLNNHFPNKLWQSSFSGMYLNIRFWFTDMGGRYLFRHQDVGTVALLLGVALVLVVGCWWKLRRQDVFTE